MNIKVLNNIRLTTKNGQKNKLSYIGLALFLIVISGFAEKKTNITTLEYGFLNPPMEVRLHSYWWWLNGNVTKDAITRDLVAMHEKGFGGTLITDAGGAEEDGNRQVPNGPLFGSQPWRELYRHALREGARLKMEMALNIQSGWNLGGPMVTPDDAAKMLGWTELSVKWPMVLDTVLPKPNARKNYVREVAVIAVPESSESSAYVMDKYWDIKTLRKPVAGANHDISSQLVAAQPAQGCDINQIIDLTKLMDSDGKLLWTVPVGNWKILRFYYTVAPRANVSSCSQGWEGLALDPMDANAFQRYWDLVIEPLMVDAENIEGRPLKYLHTDSWEIEPFNWTTRFPEEFRKRCGYDLKLWLPVLAKSVVTSVEASERFMHDFRKTVAALTAENYYRPFLSNAHRHGMQVRAESGGPHGVPIDAQHCLGMIDVPMSEFWANSWRHRVPEVARFFVKQPASAAHTYGKAIVAAEGFTTIGPHWQETVWDNLKPNFDHALCEGLNQLVWTLVTCSPKEMGLPGQEMFPGTHFNPNSTWWRQSEGFLTYINRCQWLLRKGLFVADVLYYYGNLAPNFAGYKASNPAKLPTGYDYDVASEQVILERLTVKNGRMTLPDGMSYAALVLPSHPNISLPVLQRLKTLVQAGGIIIGPRPKSSSGLKTWQTNDDKLAIELIHELWDEQGNLPGKIQPISTADWLRKAKLAPDFTVSDGVRLDYIHRRSGETEIYFIANSTPNMVSTEVTFRVSAKAPELWNPSDGSMRALPEFSHTTDGHVSVPLKIDAFGSTFVIFRKKNITPVGKVNNPKLKAVVEILPPWTVQFDSAWFYPDKNSGTKIVFENLDDWTKRPEEAIKNYSGNAQYQKVFDLPSLGGKNRKLNRYFLSLGTVREMARVKLNGREIGIAWCPPWTLSIPPSLLTEKNNRLEIEVVNFWPNRLIGDAKLPVDQRRTKTNISKFDLPNTDPHYTTLISSGLLGPVQIMVEE